MQITLQQRIDLYFQYKESYYSGNPLISDAEFDAFEEELIIDGFDPVVGTIEIISDERKANHRQKMLSLGKKKVFGLEMPEEMAIELYSKYGEGELSYKYDGCAIEAQYTNGILGLIVTRGNGNIGTNQTEKLKHLFPQKLSNPITCEIRCEIVMNQNVFDIKYSKNYKHSRNLVAGILNDINPNDERKYDLSIAVLEGIDENQNVFNPSNYHDVFKQNYKVHSICKSPKDIKDFFKLCNEKRIELGIGTDGMVYSSLNSKFEHNDHHVKYAIAIKFAPPKMISSITSITWKLQKTGRLTPKIHFTPIIVDGREINKATGHNIEYLVKYDLTIGKEVEVILSNDIIPMIKPQLV